MEIRKMAVVGAGTMGHGIAEVAALTGLEVYLIDVSWDFLNRAKEKIQESLNKLAEKKVIQDPQAVMNRITFSVDYSVVKDADFAIEAVPEKFEIKKNVFQSLDKVLPPHAIIATNTSSIPITDLAETTNRKEKFVGMHFFNPPVIMKLVEVIPGKYTSPETVETTVQLAKKMGKVPVRLSKDIPGFVGNRILLRLAQEACREVESGEATIEEVDSAARNLLKLPMGVFELSDYIGLDVMYDLWTVIVSRGTSDVPCKLYKSKVDSKELGVKSGKGFYSYPAPGKFAKPQVPQNTKVDPARLISLAVNEAAWLIENGIVNADGVDDVMIYGYNFPKGLTKMAEEIGVKKIYDHLVDIYNKGYQAYKPTKLLEEIAQGKKTFRG
jgi:3-hydroxybutyryl-CoA dehydrogenase